MLYFRNVFKQFCISAWGATFSFVPQNPPAVELIAGFNVKRKQFTSKYFFFLCTNTIHTALKLSGLGHFDVNKPEYVWCALFSFCCKDRKKQSQKRKSLQSRTGAVLISSSSRCQDDKVLFLLVSAGLCYPGESPSAVQWPPHSDACLLHRRLLPHPCGRPHHPHVHLLGQGGWWMAEM